MEKHTKGPWRTDGNGIITGGPDYCTSIGTTPVILWRTGSSGASTKNQKGQIETAQANARLIAAAPELLEACKHLCKTLKPLGILPLLIIQENRCVVYNLVLSRILP